MADSSDGLAGLSQPSPYEVLGLAPDASAVELRDRYNELQRNLQEAGGNATERARERERLDSAYNQLRVAGNRMRIDFFLLDPQLGLKQCEAIARTLARPNTDLEGIIKPRQIRVTHAVLLDELQELVREPAKVVG